MATMASHFASPSKTWDVFLRKQGGINNKQKKMVKINNLKIIRDLGVISKEFGHVIRSLLVNHA
jgi:hypothetical protein